MIRFVAFQKLFLFILFIISSFSKPYELSGFASNINQLAENKTQLECNNWLQTPSTQSFVTVGDIDVIGNQLTVEAVFNRASSFDPDLDFGKLVSKHTGPTNVNYSLMSLQCEVTTDVTGYVATPQTCIPQLDKTYHVAMVYDGATLRFYRNGYLLTETACTGNLVNNDLTTTIGQIAGNGYPDLTQFKGFIDEVRIWNVARSQDEIRRHMNSSLPTPTTQTGLLAYFTFEDLLNKQGNSAFNGTLNGSASINATNPGCALIPDVCLSSDNWLRTPSTPSYVTVGDVDVVGNNLTVEAMFNKASVFDPDLDFGKLVSKHTGPTNVNYSLLPLQCEITTDVTGYVATPQTCLPQQDKTYHAAMVYDGSSLKFYRNGYLMTTTPCTGNLVNNDLLTTIGQIAGNGYPDLTQHKGYINEVRIWNVARSQSQIQAYMNIPLPNPVSQTGLLAYYIFDDLVNKQGNATFNGTLNGSATINATNPNPTFSADSCGLFPLPAKLKDFTGFANSNTSTVLSWTTLNETDLASIQVERSIDGIHFAKIASVAAKVTNIENHYQYEDNQIPSTTDRIYYQLVLIDKDGSKQKSHIVLIKFKSLTNNLAIKPNPANTFLQISFTSAKDDIMEIKMVDMGGRLVLSRMATIKKGPNDIYLTHIDQFSSGLYTITMITTGEVVTRKLFIK